MADKPTNQPRQYLSYLLRLWQESGGDPPLWRASLQNPQSEEVRGFAGLGDLFAFLQHETRSRLPGLECSDERGFQLIEKQRGVRQ
jgi:hypothetical protein